MIGRILLSCSLLFLLFPGIQVQATKDEEGTAINQQLQQMSIEEKIGQMLMIDFSQTIGPEQVVVNESMKALIEEVQPGGVVLFKDNIRSINQTKQLTADIQRINPSMPLFIAIDQEGGEVVNRLSYVTEMPGNMALGASRSSVLTKRVASVIGKELRSLGFNMNFAPVVDMNSNPKNPIIGVRAFGENPQLVARLGTAFMKGLQDEGVIAVAKHFPGHGEAKLDSHKELPIVSKSIQELNTGELIPFRRVIDNGIQAVMTAHIRFPAIDKANIPASMSRAITTNLLREDLQFPGVVITDALNMQAVTKHFSQADAAILAVRAGADILLMPKDVFTVKRELVQAVKTNAISEERIDQSVKRILTLKTQFLYDADSVAGIHSQEHKKIEKEAARAGLVVIKQDGRLPLTSDEKVALIGDEGSSDSLRVLAKALSKAGISISTEAEAWRLIYIIRHKTDTVANHRLKMEKRPVLVISTSTPYVYNQWEFAQGFISVFSRSNASLQAVSDYLLGEFTATGCLPVSIHDASGKPLHIKQCNER